MSHTVVAAAAAAAAVVDPTSLECRQAPHSVEHWLLECPAPHEAREDIFGHQDLSLNVLDSDPAEGHHAGRVYSLLMTALARAPSSTAAAAAAAAVKY